MPTVTVKINNKEYREWTTVCDEWNGEPFKSLFELWKYWRGWKSGRFNYHLNIGFWRAVKRIWALLTVGATHTYTRKDFEYEIARLEGK